jgi:hypothetical protein
MNKLLPQNVRDIIRDIIRDRHRLLPQKLAVLLYMDISLVICGADLIVKQLSVVRQTFVLNGVIRLLEQQ